jgi:hypothetical protein
MMTDWIIKHMLNDNDEIRPEDLTSTARFKLYDLITYLRRNGSYLDDYALQDLLHQVVAQLSDLSKMLRAYEENNARLK